MEIRFFKIREPHGHMGNFYPSPVVWANKTWPTTEHLYQAQKHRLNPEYQESIRKSHSPWVAAKMGRDSSYPMLPNWDDIKDDCMRVCVFLKYTQHQGLKVLLLDTWPHKLIEKGSHDSYWAEGADGKGLNRLGVILMEVRHILRNYDQESYGAYMHEIAVSCGMYHD